MVSRNNDLETPLMLAAAAGKEETGVTLAKRFPECIPWADKHGLDAVCPPSPLHSTPMITNVYITAHALM